MSRRLFGEGMAGQWLGKLHKGLRVPLDLLKRKEGRLRVLSPAAEKWKNKGGW
jgi:hypothetical protein